MLKSKLLAIIGASMSVVVAATTALTLAISGPRNVLSLHSLSDNEAVTYGVSDLFSTATNGVDVVTKVIDTISENKAELAVGFTINDIAGTDGLLSGFGVDFNVQSDVENQQYSIHGSVAYGSIELINMLMYMDEKEMVAYVPSLFQGIITVAYDNLAENLENSYIGSLILEDGFDFEEYRDELMAIVDDATSSMSEMEYEFEYEEFAEALSDTINDAYLEAFSSMNVTDNGKQALNGGNYQSYTASVSVAELSYIVKDAIVYVLESEEFNDYLEYLTKYFSDYSLYGSYEELEGFDIDDLEDYEDFQIIDDIAGSMSISSSLSGVSTMLDSYWGMVISQIEAVLGKNIEFTIYLADSVETAGFEFYMSQNANGSFNYSKAAAENAEYAIAIKADFTGGKEIGDYTYITFSEMEYGVEMMTDEYLFKMEENGDFTLEISGSEEGYSTGLLQIDGTYTENGMFFTLDVDSLKYTDEYGKTLFDIGFLLSFEAIDGVDKPSASPEYNIWEMDEADLEALVKEIEENIEKISNALN